MIHIFAASLFGFGIIFGSIYYFYGWSSIVETLRKLFFISREAHVNDYNLYILITSIYILGSLFVSTSFLGIIFNSFIIFTKSMQISIATIYLFGEMQLSAAEIFTCYLPQMIIEVILIYVISIITLKLSLNSFMVSFVVQDNFNSKKIINYILDYLIIIMVILTVSMLFRVYLI
ncbi:MAG: hypothetical protein ACK5LC_13100 [Coprobacillaceae bacterium]